eukprot:CAMPEP_0195113020 /NCGR_PEP_ID=MMETSP0448-20130528/101064_1 /TAXON_ID=66468 /ORGANISM="Heterocapsa triquestra, Strain CCMP 448" /LENGTH=46 /DNA_ID= /DNA_START= /DNA_END= /DNA_ORIENTATION=
MEAAMGSSVESARAVVFPLAALSFALYPVALLIWTISEGQKAAREV